MLDKIKQLKFQDLLVLLCVAGMFYFFIVAKRAGPDDMRERVAQKESWLRQTSQEIADCMRYDDTNIFTTSAGLNFISSFSSPKYSKEKLINLNNHLIQEGWTKLSEDNYDEYNAMMLNQVISQPLDNAVVLCKNDTTIVLWMDNLKGLYQHTSETTTAISLIYDFRTPCFAPQDETTKAGSG